MDWQAGVTWQARPWALVLPSKDASNLVLLITKKRRPCGPPGEESSAYSRGYAEHNQNLRYETGAAGSDTQLKIDNKQEAVSINIS
jgi:hypothetical protein